MNRTTSNDNHQDVKDDQKDILTARKNDLEIVLQLVEMQGRWRAYRYEGRQCVNWIVTAGRWFPSRSDALQFIREQGYGIAEARST